MPIPLPNLDDYTYNELVAEAQAMLPTLDARWTNHNPSDPGMMLIELLAWLTEMTLYQVNEITDKHVEVYLELLNGPDWNLSTDETVEMAVRQTTLSLRDRYRAVTPEDFEYLIFNKWPYSTAAQLLGDEARIQRIFCVPQRNLTAADPTAIVPPHISVVILPPSESNTPEPSEALLQALWAYLDSRCLIAVSHHVVKPEYVPITVQAQLYLREDASLETAWQNAQEALLALFHPLTGGHNGQGWPFGRGVYASEIYAALDTLTAVDYIQNVSLLGPEEQTSTVGIDIHPHQLVAIDPTGITAIDIYGNELSE